jgi:UDP-glucuronate decarboxylase
MTPKRILVTGGAGFLGSHLCEKLVYAGHDVICLDNFFTGQKANIAHLIPMPNFEVIRHDIINPILLEVDQIYHLACPASPVHYQFNAIKTIKTSVMGTLNVLGLAKRVKATILLASTSEVYGSPQVHPQPESYWGHVNPIGPRSCYDEGKRVAETLCFDYHREAKVAIKIARIFNTYGPNMALNDGRVVSNFIVQALKNEPISLYGDGSQTRSFCYVDDMVSGLILLMNTKKSVTGPINLGNPEELTIKSLAKTICTLTKSKSQCVFEDLPQDDPHIRKPDITLAKTHLKWEPTVPIKVGLQKTIAYFRGMVGG